MKSIQHCYYGLMSGYIISNIILVDRTSDFQLIGYVIIPNAILLLGLLILSLNDRYTLNEPIRAKSAISVLIGVVMIIVLVLGYIVVNQTQENERWCHVQVKRLL